MQSTRTELNNAKAIGFPAVQRGGAPGGSAQCFAAAAALRCGVHAYVTCVNYGLIIPPVKITVS